MGGRGHEWEGGVSGKPKEVNVVWVLQGSRSTGRESWGLREESTLTSGRDRKTDTRGQGSTHSHVRLVAVSLAPYPFVLPALTVG